MKCSDSSSSSSGEDSTDSGFAGDSKKLLAEAVKDRLVLNSEPSMKKDDLKDGNGFLLIAALFQ